MFFSFDGLDGVGKTAQFDQFCDWLTNNGHDVTRCADPGTTALGQRIRAILLERDAAIGLRSEMLLFMASRAQMVDEVIRPALARGATVVSDRYLLSNVVYQGHAGGLEPAELWRIGRLATAEIMPDLTFVLDAPVELARSRISRRPDHMESQGLEYQRRLRCGFLEEARQRPDQIAIVDATQGIPAIQAEIRALAAAVIARAANQR